MSWESVCGLAGTAQRGLSHAAIQVSAGLQPYYRPNLRRDLLLSSLRTVGRIQLLAGCWLEARLCSLSHGLLHRVTPSRKRRQRGSGSKAELNLVAECGKRHHLAIFYSWRPVTQYSFHSRRGDHLT